MRNRVVVEYTVGFNNSLLILFRVGLMPVLHFSEEISMQDAITCMPTFAILGVGSRSQFFLFLFKDVTSTRNADGFIHVFPPVLRLSFCS